MVFVSSHSAPEGNWRRVLLSADAGSVGPVWGRRFCLSLMLPGTAAPAGPGLHVKE